MSASALVLVLGVAAIFAWGLAFGGRLPKALRSRSCQGRGWRTAYPSATKQEIRAFLSLFVSAFALHDREKLKLAPTDEILGIYRARNPNRWQPDALELESLALELERQYGFKLEALWSERLTLGELFNHAHVNGASAK